MTGIVRASPGHESHSRDREEELEPGFRETSVSFSRTIVLSKTRLQTLLFHPSFNLSRPVYWCGHIRCLDAGWRMKGVVIVVISDNINISSRASCLQSSVPGGHRESSDRWSLVTRPLRNLATPEHMAKRRYENR